MPNNDNRLRGFAHHRRALRRGGAVMNYNNDMTDDDYIDILEVLLGYSFVLGVYQITIGICMLYLFLQEVP